MYTLLFLSFVLLIVIFNTSMNWNPAYILSTAMVFIFPCLVALAGLRLDYKLVLYATT